MNMKNIGLAALVAVGIAYLATKVSINQGVDAGAPGSGSPGSGSGYTNPAQTPDWTAAHGLIDTGVDVGGADLLIDAGTGNPYLASGIALIGTNVTQGILGCQTYNKVTNPGGLIWDNSTQQCHDVAWFKTHQPGLAATWGL